VEWKPRTLYFAALKNGDAENFFGPVLATDPVTQNLLLHHLDPAGSATLTVTLQGVTLTPHTVGVSLNGIALGTMTFTGQTRGVAQFTVPSSLLHDGDNPLTLLSQGGEIDVSLVEGVALTYRHTYSADTDALRATAPGRSTVTIGGFTSPEIQVVDITAPQAVKAVASRVTAQTGGFAATFTVPGTGLRTLLALTPSQSLTPTLTANTPSAWHAGGQGADLVILAHEAFLPSLAPLQALRQAQGYRVAVLDVQDVYDEFSFGVKSPTALHDFLRRAASQWAPSPRFVLLVGDASVDPRNYLGLGEADFVPTKLVDTAYLETASDDWFADVNGDGVPEMAVGRLPVQTPEEAATVVAKLVDYAQAAGPWRTSVLLVADRPDSFDFEAATAQVAAWLPATLTLQGLFVGQTDDATAGREILAGFTDGQGLVNYMGHGSTEVWRGGTLTSSEARTLTNGPRLPVVVAMTCLNGFFHDLYTESLAEALLRAEAGGAVAVWASSGLTAPEGQAVMTAALYQRLFDGSRPTLGEAIRQAKAAVSDPDLRRTWLLFGDPTTRLAVQD
jgi:hypothetical protein